MAHLTEFERYQIAHDLRLGLGLEEIAAVLGCSCRRIEREISRCGSREKYCPVVAQRDRDRCARRSAANHRTKSATVWQEVEEALQQKHSPEQIQHTSGAVSASAIYRYLQRTGKRRLRARLRHAPAKRRGGQMAWVKRAQPIRHRPKSVMTRDTIGHLEGDTLVGKRHQVTKILVVLDRATRYVRLGLVRDGCAATVARHIQRWAGDPRLPMLTLTCDQGYEFSSLPELLPGRLYACDPGKPYQKGAVENMNGLIRQYLPKGKSLLTVTQARLDRIAKEINHRPRKRLSWKSPAQLLSELTAATTI